MASHRFLRGLITGFAGIAAASSLAQAIGGNSVPDTWASLTAETGTLVGGLTTRCNARMIVGANPGQAVLLSSNTVKIAVPASVSFVTGRKNAYFNARTQTVLADGTGTITASLNGYIRVLTLTLLVGGLTDGFFQDTVVSPPFSSAPDDLIGMVALNNFVWLSGLAGASGVEVELRSSNPSVLPVPASVTIPAFSTTSAQIPLIAAQGIQVATPVIIRAKYGNSLRYFTVTVVAPEFVAPFDEIGDPQAR